MILEVLNFVFAREQGEPAFSLLLLHNPWKCFVSVSINSNNSKTKRRKLLY